MEISNALQHNFSLNLLDAEGTLVLSTFTGMSDGNETGASWLRPELVDWLWGACVGTNEECPLKLAASMPRGRFNWGSQWLLRTFMASSRRSSMRVPCKDCKQEIHYWWVTKCLNQFIIKRLHENNTKRSTGWTKQCLHEECKQLTVAFSAWSRSMPKASSSSSGWLVFTTFQLT